MEGAPATALVPVGPANEAMPLAPPTPGVVSSIPAEDAAEKKSREKHFTTLRKVVEIKEMELGDLCETHGLGACLKTMAEREHNPILQDGAYKFTSFGDAYVAVQRVAASLGCLLVKNGSKSQKTPFIQVELPFDPAKLYDNKHPRMNWRLRCERMHNKAAEDKRNFNGHCCQSAPHRRPHSGNKGVPPPTAPCSVRCVDGDGKGRD